MHLINVLFQTNMFRILLHFSSFCYCFCHLSKINIRQINIRNFFLIFWFLMWFRIHMQTIWLIIERGKRLLWYKMYHNMKNKIFIYLNVSCLLFLHLTTLRFNSIITTRINDCFSYFNFCARENYIMKFLSNIYNCCT